MLNGLVSHVIGLNVKVLKANNDSILKENTGKNYCFDALTKREQNWEERHQRLSLDTSHSQTVSCLKFKEEFSSL